MHTNNLINCYKEKLNSIKKTPKLVAMIMEVDLRHDLYKCISGIWKWNNIVVMLELSEIGIH